MESPSEACCESSGAPVADLTTELRVSALLLRRGATLDRAFLSAAFFCKIARKNRQIPDLMTTSGTLRAAVDGVNFSLTLNSLRQLQNRTYTCASVARSGLFAKVSRFRIKFSK